MLPLLAQSLSKIFNNTLPLLIRVQQFMLIQYLPLSSDIVSDYLI